MASRTLILRHATAVRCLPTALIVHGHNASVSTNSNPSLDQIHTTAQLAQLPLLEADIERSRAAFSDLLQFVQHIHDIDTVWTCVVTLVQSIRVASSARYCQRPSFHF